MKKMKDFAKLGSKNQSINNSTKCAKINRFNAFFAPFTFHVSPSNLFTVYRLPFTKKSFTLAEVLITLGIIGVVAAITIPILQQNIQDQQFKQMWKKEYSVISQAYERIKQDEGGDLSGYFNPTVTEATAPIINQMAKYLSYIALCDIPYTVDYNYACGIAPNASLNNAYKTLSDGYVQYSNIQMGQLVLKDGAYIYFRMHSATVGSQYLLIFVDVNGFNKKPNILGKDLFGITITKDKAMPMGAKGTGVENTCNKTAITCSADYGFYQGSGNTNDCAGAGCSMEYLSQ